MNIAELLATLQQFEAVKALGALMAIATSLQVLLGAVGLVWKPALKAAHVVGVVAVDIGKLAGFLRPMGARAAALGKGLASKSLVLCVAILSITGYAACARPAHFNDPSLEQATSTACDALASKNVAELQRQADAQGFTLDHVIAIFKGACQARLLAASRPASLTGLAAARGQPVDLDDAGAP